MNTLPQVKEWMVRQRIGQYTIRFWIDANICGSMTDAQLMIQSFSNEHFDVLVDMGIVEVAEIVTDCLKDQKFGVAAFEILNGAGDGLVAYPTWP